MHHTTPRDARADRPLPANIEAERTILTSIITRPAIMADVAAIVQPADWHGTHEKIVYGRMAAMHAAGEPILHTLLVGRLKDSGDLERIGGMDFLIELMQLPAMLADYTCCLAREVRQHAERRRLVTLTERMHERAYIDDPADVLAELRDVPTAQTADAPWPALIPFADRELPEFPVRVLPAALRRWVEAESHATQTPPDLSALLALSVVSACIARRVEVKARPGWIEPTNLFTAILLEPGNRKSAVFADALRPLRDVESALIEQVRPIVARAQSGRRQDEARLRKAEKIAAETGDKEARHEAGNLAEELSEQPEAVLPRLLADDATAEKLGMMLAEQGGRIFSASPEGNVFDLMAGQYSKNGSPQFDVYLKGHAGDDLRTDRVSRQSVCIVRPALTCAYTVQPAVIAGLAEQPAFRGRGLLARFLYAAPSSPIGRREISPEPVPDNVREDYVATIRALALREGEHTLELLPSAKAALQVWEAEIENMLADGGEMEFLRDWGGKLAGATLRLAAALHCAEHGPEGKISPETIGAAISIARYLIPHADAALAMMTGGGPTASDAQWVLSWIMRHEKTEFSKSEAQQHGKRRFPRAEDIDPPLRELARRGYIRQRPAEPDGPGRPPSPVFDVSPAISPNAEKRSRYSDNSPTEPENGNLQNIQSAFGQIENQEPDLEEANAMLAQAAEEEGDLLAEPF